MQSYSLEFSTPVTVADRQGEGKNIGAGTTQLTCSPISGRKHIVFKCMWKTQGLNHILGKKTSLSRFRNNEVLKYISSPSQN